MKETILFISLLIGFLSFGQDAKLEEKTNSEKESKVRLSPFFSYDFNLSDKLVEDGDAYYILNYDRFNYKIGIDVEFKITDSFSVSTGFNYSVKDFTSTSLFNSMDLIEERQFDLSYLEIPMTVIYTYKVKDFEFFGQLGIINHINIGLNIFIPDSGIALHNIDSYSVSGKVGLGASYPILGRHRLFLATDYSTGLSNVFKNVDYKLKTLGIRMGIQFLL